MSYNLPLLTVDGGPSPALATQTLQMIAGGSITAGDVVAFDTTLTGEDRVQTVVQAAGVATVGNARAIGFAQTSAVAGEAFPVVVGGYFANANVDGGTAIGTALVGPIGTAGQAGLASAANTTAPVLCVALEADTTNVAAVYVFRQLI
jgi:hypothetical protein